MKNKLVCIILALFLWLGRPASAADFTLAYDAHTKQTLTLALQPLHVEHDVLGFRGFDVQVSALAGLGQSLTGGFAFTAPLKISRETAIFAGVFVRAEAGQRTRGGLVIGLGTRR